MHFGHGKVEGENAGLSSLHPSTRPPHGTARVLGSSGRRFLPDTVHRTTTHTVDRHAAREPRQPVRSFFLGRGPAYSGPEC